MVNTKITNPKRKRAIDLTQGDEDSLEDEEKDVDEEKEDLLTLSPSTPSILFRSFFRSTDKRSAAPASAAPNVQIENTATDELEIDNEGRRTLELLQEDPETVTELKEVSVLVTCGWLDLGVGSVYLRFTAEVVEVRGEGHDLLHEWPLSRICLIGAYYRPACDEEETIDLVAMRIHKHEEGRSCCSIACLKEHDLYLLQVCKFRSQLLHIFQLSTKYGDIFKQLDREDMPGFKHSVQVIKPQMVVSAEPSNTVGLEQAIEAFEGLVFPQDDPDAVTITKKDIRILKPLEFLNDTIIDFYIKYLQQSQVPPTSLESLHFFNSFFFSKLAETDTSLTGGRAAFERVKKWTRKVNVFKKDYIFIPVNQSFHWSLIIICHPGNVWESPDSSGSFIGEPCILHLDSMEGSHKAVEGHIKNYLLEEWIERNQGYQDRVHYTQVIFAKLPFVYARVPQQDNNCDCGLFLLHYVELFLKEAPTQFSLSRRSPSYPYFLKRSWFKPSEASAKRPFIQKLIFELSQGKALGNPKKHFKSKACLETDEYSGDDEYEGVLSDSGIIEACFSNCQPGAFKSSCPQQTNSGEARNYRSDNCARGVCKKSMAPGREVCISSEGSDCVGNQERDVNLATEIRNFQEDTEESDDDQNLYNGRYNSVDTYCAREPGSDNNVGLVMEDDYGCPIKEAEEIWKIKDCPVPVLTQVRPLEFPSMLASPTKCARDDRQPSSPETLVPPEDTLDEDSLCLWPVENTGSYQEAKQTLTMSHSSIQESTDDEREQNMSVGAYSDLEIIESDRFEEKGEKSEACIRSEVIRDVDYATRLFEPACSPLGRSSLDSTFAHLDTSESCEERVFSWLKKEETRQRHFKEETYGSSRYSEIELLDRLGGTSGVRELRRDSCLAHSRLKNIEPWSQEVEVLSSDDSVEEWDYRDQGKLYECSISPQIVRKRLTRSKTQRLKGKELSEKERARQNALAICISNRRHR